MLPEWLGGPLRAVLPDLQRPTAVPIRASYEPGAEFGELWWVCPPDERRIARIGDHAA